MDSGLIISIKSKITEAIAGIAASADHLPGIVTIQDVRNFQILYMSQSGLKIFNTSLEELKGLTREEYEKRYFKADDSYFYTPKIRQLIEDNDDQKSISFFQQVKVFSKEMWSWHISSMRILMRADDGSPLLAITNSFPLESFCHISTKLDKFLKEDRFVRMHYQDFWKLGKREKEVLRLLALGKSSTETAEQLFISTATVETHRKNIKRKLGTNSFFELCEYARAFDMI